jgi:hypothetical protein
MSIPKEDIAELRKYHSSLVQGHAMNIGHFMNLLREHLPALLDSYEGSDTDRWRVVRDNYAGLSVTCNLIQDCSTDPPRAIALSRNPLTEDAMRELVRLANRK